jgi:hypothetical protein
VLLVLLPACARRLDGPLPRASDILPRLACATRTTPITVMGENFAPLPTGALRSSERLQLPSVLLQQTGTLEGAVVSSAAVPILDDPDAPHVRWESPTQLGFDVPAGLFGPGSYDLTVRNPGGGSALLPHVLAIVPPPTVSSFTPDAVCASQAVRPVTLYGDFLQVADVGPTVSLLDDSGASVLDVPATTAGCSPTAVLVLDGVFRCSTLQIEIPRDALPAGEYQLRVTDPAPANCDGTAPMALVLSPPPRIDVVAPPTVCEGGGLVTAGGANFQTGATLQVGGQMPAMSTVDSAQVMSATFDVTAGFNGGDHLDLIVSNPDGCGAIAAGAVTVKPGGVLFAVDPSALYRPYATPLTLFLKSLQPPLKSVTVTAASSRLPTLLTDARIDPNHANRVLATLPGGLAADDYQIAVVDSSGCPAQATLLRVSQHFHINLKSVVPAFGTSSTTNTITVTTAGLAGEELAPGAHAWLAPHLGGTAIPLGAWVLDDSTLQAVVPSGLAVGQYAVVVVNPDGDYGVLDSPGTPLAAYAVEPSAPPTVSAVVPEALATSCTAADCAVTIRGAAFGSAPSVSATCYAPRMTLPLATRPSFSVLSSTADTVVVNASPATALPIGTRCFFRVANFDLGDQPFADAEAPLVMTGAPARLTAPIVEGGQLKQPRRGAATVLASPAPRTRFVYAIGGDAGTLDKARTDVELAPSTLAGLGDFALLPRSSLPAPRALVGAAVAGRFLFVVGGYDGAQSAATVWRAQVLDPAEAPTIADTDFAVLSGTTGNGFVAGRYFYRVAALFADTDPYNPGGESLASPEVTVTVPTYKRRFTVTLRWTGGVKDLPSTPPRVLRGYRVYRGIALNGENAYVDLDPATSSFTDDGTATAGPLSPLPLGALGRFTATGVPQLAVPRAGAAVTVAPDPTVAGRYYLYAAFGRDTTGTTALPASYESLQVDVSAAGTDFGGATAFTKTDVAGANGRWLAGAFAATPAQNGFVVGDAWVYFGSGTKNATLSGFVVGDSVDELDAGRVDATNHGVLATVTTALTPKGTEFGYGATIVANTLLLVGGATVTKPDPGVWDSPLTQNMLPQNGVWSSNSAPLPEARFLPGAILDRGYLYVIGGATVVTSTALWFTNASAGTFMAVY